MNMGIQIFMVILVLNVIMHLFSVDENWGTGKLEGALNALDTRK